ncbi:MAG: GIY-YIG nuclease family protein [Rhizobiaceae bacterium]|nr:GIY-YIG nuclease family protein [Rhizobiaceae bacterium]
MDATVYILRCSDGSYYTGLTKQDVEARVWEHNQGIYDGYTKKRRPVELVFTETYDRVVDAIARERQIKGWSRAKKEALIALAYERLPELARNREGGAQRPHGSPFDKLRMRAIGKPSPAKAAFAGVGRYCRLQFGRKVRVAEE